MKIRKYILLTIVATIFLFTSIAVAHEWEGWRGSEGWNTGHPYMRMYNPKAVETVSGEVIRLETVVPMEGMSEGVHILLLTDKETIPVHLGPVWFVERLDVKLKKGDKIEVTGSKVIMNKKHVLLATQVKKGDMILQLRDATGEPVWQGWEKIGKEKK
jgi:hypothetical protein